MGEIFQKQSFLQAVSFILSTTNCFTASLCFTFRSSDVQIPTGPKLMPLRRESSQSLFNVDEDILGASLLSSLPLLPHDSVIADIQANRSLSLERKPSTSAPAH